jgi:hypothetical protein
MSNYFRLAWAGNIIKREIEAFDKRVENNLDIKHSNTLSGGTAVGDFNGDGYIDVLTTFYGVNYEGVVTDNPVDGQMILLLGTKAGSFKNGTGFLPNHGRVDASIAVALQVADFNEDGIDDVILPCHFEDGRREDGVSSLVMQRALMSGDGGPHVVDLDFETWGRTSTSGDYNSDGLMDFIVNGYADDPDGGESAALYLQNVDGTLTQKWLDFGGNIMETGDFDGDGDLEIADWTSEWENGVPARSGMRTFEINPDGTLGAMTEVLTPAARFEEGINWTGDPSLFAINVDKNGKEYLDLGIHFSTTGDLNGDGKDDIVGVRFANDIGRNKNGVIDERLSKSRCQLDIFMMTENGLELTNLKVRGWTSPEFGVERVELMDWNGDGHLDLFVPWQYSKKEYGPSEGARVFINDGVGNFDRLPQKYIPGSKNGEMVEIANAFDANGDGIVDLLVRPRGHDGSWNQWGKASETLYLGTKRIFGDGSTHNPAKEGAAGFNEAYYLNQIEANLSMMKVGGYQSALEHYLAVGKASGEFGFAAGTHVYGYKGSETIVLREGNESVDALGGDDTITGAAGADTLNGGKGADTFVYLSVADSGVTAATRDIIEDFVSGTDEIDLSAIDAIAGTSSNDTFVLLGADGAAFTGAAGELRWHSAGSGKNAIRIVEGDVDGDAVADIQIELLGSGEVKEGDFVL